MKIAPTNLSIGPGHGGTDKSLLPIQRITVNRLVSIQYKIRKSGLFLVDVAEIAGLKFTSVYALVYLGLIDHGDLTRLEQVFERGEVDHV